MERLSDSQLRIEIVSAAAAEREATAHLIALLAEFDRRRLYLDDGYRSLFAYCTGALHLSESAAYTRIQATRASRKWPRVLEVLRDGSVTLTAIGLLAPHLTPTNCDDLLSEARHKGRTEIECIVARLKPQPDVPATIRKLPAPKPSVPLSEGADNAPPAPTPLEAEPPLPPAAPSITAPPKPAVIAPLAPERYKIQVTVDRETHDVLREAQDLMRHTIPNGDPAAIIAKALRVLVDGLLKKKSAATARPRSSRELLNGSRAIPAAVKRTVWERDGGRCAFNGLRGRCDSRGALEYHHVIPYAMGGEATVENIELRCRAHNAHEARLAGLPTRPLSSG